MTRTRRAKLRDAGLTLLRIGAAALMLKHGIQKLINFETIKTSFPDPVGLGAEQGLMLVIGAEVGCAILLILGFFTRLATLPLIATMAVVIFMHLSNGDPFSNVELPLLYAIVFITLLFAGPGSPSIDRKFAMGVGALRNNKPEPVPSVAIDRSIPVPPSEPPFELPEEEPVSPIDL